MASSQHGQHPAATRVGKRSPLGWIALGVALALRGPLVLVAIAVSALTAIAFLVLALVVARRGGDAPVESVPVLASSAIAWGGGFLHAVAVSGSALRRDRAEGIRSLFETRTTTLRGYLAGRVGGLGCVLAAIAGGGTLLVSAAVVLGASQTHAVARAAQAAVAALVYGLAFGVVIAPVSFAALGARTRAGGYLVLMLVLVVPELLTSALSTVIPSDVAELCAIPSALAAVRSSLAPGTMDALRLLRALVALAVFAAAATMVVRRDSALVRREAA